MNTSCANALHAEFLQYVNAFMKNNRGRHAAGENFANFIREATKKYLVWYSAHSGESYDDYSPGPDDVVCGVTSSDDIVIAVLAPSRFPALELIKRSGRWQADENIGAFAGMSIRL